MIGYAVGTIVLGGMLGGSVLAPIKLMRRWRFEESWAVYSAWAYLIVPWLVALLTIPHLLTIYTEVSLRTMLICGLCGLGWGAAVILLGISVRLIGLSLSTAILYGASIAFGSLMPLLISHRQQLLSERSLAIVLADTGVIAGVLLCAWAGKMRDTTPEVRAKEIASPQILSKGFTRGLIAALLGAVLSSLFNLALAYGGEFNRLAIAQGANPLNAANAQWAFTTTFGYLPNLLLTIVTFSRLRAWKKLYKGPASYWLWPPLMGAMFVGGTVLYGVGVELLGDAGPILGWPMYMSMIIIAGVFWGWTTREWEGAQRRTSHFLVAGIGLQVLFIIVLGVLGR